MNENLFNDFLNLFDILKQNCKQNRIYINFTNLMIDYFEMLVNIDYFNEDKNADFLNNIIDFNEIKINDKKIKEICFNFLENDEIDNDTIKLIKLLIKIYDKLNNDNDNTTFLKIKSYILNLYENIIIYFIFLKNIEIKNNLIDKRLKDLNENKKENIINELTKELGKINIKPVNLNFNKIKEKKVNELLKGLDKIDV